MEDTALCLVQQKWIVQDFVQDFGRCLSMWGSAMGVYRGSGVWVLDVGLQWFIYGFGGVPGGG